MPIYSMTGFARVQVSVHDQLSYTLSLKSVNHRFLDLQLRMPNGLDALEVELRKALKDALVRGHVDVTLNVDRTAQQRTGYNRELVAGYLAAFVEARDEFGLTGEPDLNAVLRMPGALQSDNRGDDDLTVLADSVREQIGPLLEELKTMRAREGESLKQILHATLDRLTDATNGVAELRPEIEQRFQDRLTQRLLAATGPEFNRQRLLEEVAVIVERSDVSEELARLRSHVQQFDALLGGAPDVGKKLDFLLQEMNRETNTILSKTGGLGDTGLTLTDLGLAAKAEIDRIREQALNIE